jgi:hypothetical protein
MASSAGCGSGGPGVRARVTAPLAIVGSQGAGGGNSAPQGMGGTCASLLLGTGSDSGISTAARHLGLGNSISGRKVMPGVAAVDRGGGGGNDGRTSSPSSSSSSSVSGAGGEEVKGHRGGRGRAATDGLAEWTEKSIADAICLLTELDCQMKPPKEMVDSALRLSEKLRR